MDRLLHQSNSSIRFLNSSGHVRKRPPEVLQALNTGTLRIWENDTEEGNVIWDAHVVDWNVLTRPVTLVACLT